MNARHCLLAWALAASAASAAGQPRFDFDQTRTVLPKTVLPSHYDLALRVDPQHGRFDGRARIAVRVREPVRTITLHARQLEARSATLSTGKTERRLRVAADAKTGTWKLTPIDGRPIAAGAHRVVIAYRGTVNRSGEGLFRADHRADGKRASMLATQLQAVNARMLFPGWDEPLFRASFGIEVTAPRGYQVLSNQPVAQRREAAGKVIWRFAKTPSMPSYLVALAVGRFDVLEGRSGSVPLRIFTPPGKREQARFAMRATQEVLPYFSDYFGTPYALPKLDQLAVPGTRDGAMEDWGLISYVEDALLVEPGRSPPRVERGAYNTIAHEIAHQWFGNLVSVALWDEIWLNEAFATWMANKATERFRPEWQLQLTSREWLERTLARDATAATRPIRPGAVDEARVFDVFDGITYNKGGAVLSMLEQWIGEDAFRRGLAAYMQERRMGSATAGDLWHHVGAAAQRPVAAVAASWTDQPGFPLVDVGAACDGGRTVVTLSQQRFAAHPKVSSGGAWQVPVRAARGAQLQTWLLDQPQARFEQPGCDDAAIVLNAGGRGFYRVRYSEPLQQRLQRDWPALAAADQVTLLVDSYALAMAGQQPLAQHFAWLAQVPRATGTGRAPLIAQAAQQLMQLDRALHGTPAQAPLRAAGRALLAPELQRLGWQERSGEDAETQRLRGVLVNTLAQLGDAAVLAQARTLWPAAWARDASRLPGSLRGPVLNAVARQATAAEWETLWAALRSTDKQEERWLYLQALSHDADPARIQRLLDASLAGWLPPNVATDVPGLVADQPQHARTAYAFVEQRWPKLAALAGSGVFGARAWLLPGAADGLADRDSAQRLRADQQRLAGPAGAMPAETVAAAIEVRAALREREGDRLQAAIAAWSPAR
jgi:aminopeptidase N